MAKLSLRNLTKEFEPGVAAVKNLSIDICDREFVVLVGPTGCGKSTTLRMIAGLEEPTEGDIYIDGKQMTWEAPKDRNIAMVFQNYPLYPHLSVYDNITYGLYLRREPEYTVQRRVEDAVKLLGLEELLDRKPSALSGGQRQRVAIGRAVVRKPCVFLMDEPLSNLDPATRDTLRYGLLEYQGRLQTGFLYVTHDLTEAMTLGTRILVMRDGVIQQDGTPEEVYNRPANQFVAGFMGFPPMNFIEAGIEALGGDILLSVGDSRIPLPEDMAEALRQSRLAGGKLVLGIRPEHITCHTPDEAEGQAQAGAPMPAATRMYSELRGADTLLHLDMAGVPLTVRVDSRLEPRLGRELRVCLQPDALHLFHPDTQELIVRAALEPDKGLEMSL